MQEQIELEVQVEMAKVRDKHYIEQQISDNDIEMAIQKLRLETDPEYARLMQEHTSQMNKL